MHRNKSYQLAEARPFAKVLYIATLRCKHTRALTFENIFSYSIQRGLSRTAFKLFLGRPVAGKGGGGVWAGAAVRAAEEEACGWWCLWASLVPESRMWLTDSEREAGRL